MKVESASGIVHRVAETFDTRYLNDMAKTKCGRELQIVPYVPEDGTCRRTHRAITCKSCKRK